MSSFLVISCANTVANSVLLRICRPCKYGVERADIVTPAKAGAQKSRNQQDWIPACAGMTESSLAAVIPTTGADGWPEKWTELRNQST